MAPNQFDAEGPLARAAGDKHHHGDAATEREAKHQHQQHWYDVRDVHSGPNLRVSVIHSNRK